jgi:CRP-like cAMP-binding protein
MLTNDLDTKIRERIWYVYRRNGIEIPYPVRHLLVENIERPTVGATSEGANRVRAIDAVSLFEPLCAEERLALADAAVQHVYAPGEAILRRGDAGDSMFIVQRGQVEVRLAGTNSDLGPVAVLDPGGYFGEMGLLTGEPRTADITALGEASILEIKKSALQPLLEENTALAAALSERVANRQAQLSELSQVAMPEEEKQNQKQSILRRVQRFFSLS